MLRTTFFVATSHACPDTLDTVRGEYEIIRPAASPEDAAMFAHRYNGDPSKSGTITSFVGPNGQAYLVEDFMYLLNGEAVA